MSQQKVVLKEGLFKEDSKGPLLVASKCNGCGRVFFPAREYCPECFGKDMKQVSLHGPGRLYSYTISQMPTQHYKPPYAIGWIEFPEGLRVFGQIKGWQERPLKIGIEMKLIIDTLWTEAEKEVTGYKFEPAAR
jgi:uncharacterized protein